MGPLAFALTALTSIMLLNYISRQFGELVGKGLPWPVIGQFFMLAVPFTVALTVPMSVLVAVLYAFSRLAAENEVMALKANGVSPWRLVTPALVSGVIMSVGLLAFNDQVLPRANHRLKTLQEDISQTKPTLLLKEQVINPLAEGKFYLKAGKIDQAAGKMREVVIYDLADPTRRRTIYADSGRIAFSANRVDIDLDLFDGQMQEVSTEKPSQLDRLFYASDRIKIRDVGRDFRQSKTDSLSKGEREMSICEMQKRLWDADNSLRFAQSEYSQAKSARAGAVESRPLIRRTGAEPHGLGWLYCAGLGRLMEVREAHASDLSGMRLHAAVDTVGADTLKRDSTAKRDSTKGDTTHAVPASTPVPPAPARRDSAARPAPAVAPALPIVPGMPAGMTLQNGRLVPITPLTGAPTTLTPVPGGVVPAGPVPAAPVPVADSQAEVAARAAAAVMRGVTNAASGPLGMTSREAEAKLRVDLAQRQRNGYDLEIHKKFSLAAACLIFVIVAAPIAVRFPRGGVGLVIGVSLVVFALYYVGLIGGESLARRALLPPFWAMWGTNLIMTGVGVVMMLRMGHDSNTGRGGGMSDRIYAWRLRREMRRAARPASRTAAETA